MKERPTYRRQFVSIESVVEKLDLDSEPVHADVVGDNVAFDVKRSAKEHNEEP